MIPIIVMWLFSIAIGGLFYYVFNDAWTTLATYMVANYAGAYPANFHAFFTAVWRYLPLLLPLIGGFIYVMVEMQRRGAEGYV